MEQRPARLQRSSNVNLDLLCFAKYRIGSTDFNSGSDIHHEKSRKPDHIHRYRHMELRPNGGGVFGIGGRTDLSAP